MIKEIKINKRYGILVNVIVNIFKFFVVFFVKI